MSEIKIENENLSDRDLDTKARYEFYLSAITADMKSRNAFGGMFTWHDEEHIAIHEGGMPAPLWTFMTGLQRTRVLVGYMRKYLQFWISGTDMEEIAESYNEEGMIQFDDHENMSSSDKRSAIMEYFYSELHSDLVHDGWIKQGQEACTLYEVEILFNSVNLTLVEAQNLGAL